MFGLVASPTQSRFLKCTEEEKEEFEEEGRVQEEGRVEVVAKVKEVVAMEKGAGRGEASIVLRLCSR